MQIYNCTGCAQYNPLNQRMIGLVMHMHRLTFFIAACFINGTRTRMEPPPLIQFFPMSLGLVSYRKSEKSSLDGLSKLC